MKLLQKYPWLIPDDGEEWVPVEATPIVETLRARVEEGSLTGLSSRAPWPRVFIEYTAPGGVRGRHALRVEVNYGLDDYAEVWTCDAFISAARGRPVRLCTFQIGVSESGTVEGWRVIEDKVPIDSEVTYAKVEARTLQGLFAFLNCKNVTVEDEYVPAAVRKKRRKSGKKADIIYKQLVVDGRPIARRPGPESKEDADWRYHICRGHWADHREHGLFGKESLKGIYWVRDHVRGSKSHGEVIKDYLVSP